MRFKLFGLYLDVSANLGNQKLELTLLIESVRVKIKCTYNYLTGRKDFTISFDPGLTAVKDAG